MTPASLARSVAAFAATGVGTLTFASLALASGLCLGPSHSLVDFCYRNFARTLLRGFGARVASAGGEELDPGCRYVFVANHQSYLDPLAILASLPAFSLRFVAKRDLLKIPVFGAALRATGGVMISRSDTQGDIRSLDAAQHELGDRVSVLFFPEGTRSPDGKLRTFKKGAAAFAIKTGWPLVPIGVAGSFEIFPKGFEVRRAGCIGVAIGEAIATEGRSWDEREVLTESLQSAVAALCTCARAERMG